MRQLQKVNAKSEREARLARLEAPRPPETKYKPGHRVAAAPAGRVTGELPWWAAALREGMTAIAEQATSRVASTDIAPGVPVRRITPEDVIARHRQLDVEGRGVGAEMKRRWAAKKAARAAKRSSRRTEP